MKSVFAALISAALLLTACTTTPETIDVVPMPAASAEAAPRPDVGGWLPANSEFVLELQSPLSSDSSNVGDVFTATVTEAVVAKNGDVIIPAGAVATGMVTGVDDSDHAGDQAAIKLNFLRINVKNVTHPFSADIMATQLEPQTRRDPDDVAKAAAAGAVVGAVLGAVIGRDMKDALLGAALGAGAGTIISLGTGEAEAVLPVGTRLTVRTRDTMDLRAR